MPIYTYLSGEWHSFHVTNRGRPPLLSEETILEKALEAFATKGFAAMSVRALNAELGLSHEAISRRFGPKSELFRSAVAHGVQHVIADFNDEVSRLAPANDLERLRAILRAFMVVSSRHPVLGELLHHESIDEQQRAVLMSEIGLGGLIADTVALLHQLHESGVIRDTKIREIWFLAQGAAEPLRFHQFSQMFDFFDGPIKRDAHIDKMVDVIVRGILI